MGRLPPLRRRPYLLLTRQSAPGLSIFEKMKGRYIRFPGDTEPYIFEDVRTKKRVYAFNHEEAKKKMGLSCNQARNYLNNLGRNKARKQND